MCNLYKEHNTMRKEGDGEGEGGFTYLKTIQ